MFAGRKHQTTGFGRTRCNIEAAHWVDAMTEDNSLDDYVAGLFVLPLYASLVIISFQCRDCRGDGSCRRRCAHPKPRWQLRILDTKNGATINAIEDAALSEREIIAQ